MYQAAVPPLLQILGSLVGIIDKTDAHCSAAKIAPEVMLQTRLIPDMFPLVRQVQIVTDHAKGAVARLAGQEIPSYPDSEADFVSLKERLRKTIAFVKSFKPEQIDGSEEKNILLKLGGTEKQFSGRHYLLNFCFPNVYFHAATAYAILRSSGVAIGKKDFLGEI
jgi:hypothetical protein